MKVIGLTGGIACGKSTVARILSDLGAVVVDADAVVHRLQEPGQEVYRQIVEAFGPSILAPDGRLDRAALGRIVFADPEALARLEALTHPAVIAEVERLLGQITAPAAVVEAVKLVEAGMHERCDSLWLVVCRPEVQASRLASRGLDEAAIRARLRAQPAVDGMAAIADVVIENSGSSAETRRQVEAAWRSLGLPISRSR